LHLYNLLVNMYLKIVFKNVAMAMNRDILTEQYIWIQILFRHFIYNPKKCVYLLIKDVNGPIFKIVKPFWDFVTYMPRSGV